MRSKEQAEHTKEMEAQLMLDENTVSEQSEQEAWASSMQDHQIQHLNIRNQAESSESFQDAFDSAHHDMTKEKSYSKVDHDPVDVEMGKLRSETGPMTSVDWCKDLGRYPEYNCQVYQHSSESASSMTFNRKIQDASIFVE